jgi:hypothetical protein
VIYDSTRDIIRDLRNNTELPVAAYQVSGEYSQIHAAAQLGLLDLEKTRDESLLGIKRAGADMILTYFAKAVARHVVDGARKVSKKIYKERLEQCHKCVFHKRNRCSHMKCGCVLTKKARWNSEDCPIGRWPKSK